MGDTRLQVRGEIDDRAVPSLRARLRLEVDATDGDLLVDCSQVPFLDSDGILPLLEAQRALRSRNRRLVLLNLRHRPRRKLELLGLSEFLSTE